MRNNNFNIGDAVVCTPKDLAFAYEFEGEIVDIKETYLTVRDNEDNYFDVDFDQVKTY